MNHGKRNSGMKRALFIGMLIALMAWQPVMAQKSYRDATSGFLNETQFLSSAARTTSDSTAVPVDIGPYDTGNIIVNITAVSGSASPTLTVIFDVCADATVNKCVQHSATAGLTATGLTLLKVNQLGRYHRIRYTISGTTPSFTFEVYGVFKPTT
jgi:hypothetical protein